MLNILFTDDRPAFHIVMFFSFKVTLVIKPLSHSPGTRGNYEKAYVKREV